MYRRSEYGIESRLCPLVRPGGENGEFVVFTRLSVPGGADAAVAVVRLAAMSGREDCSFGQNGSPFRGESNTVKISALAVKLAEL